MEIFPDHEKSGEKIKETHQQLQNSQAHLSEMKSYREIRMVPEIDYAKLGNKIKDMRKQQHLTQENLAECVDCNSSHISNIENNHTKVSLNVLLAIANSLNTSIDYLLSDQYNNSSLALDNEINRLLKDCDDDKKRKIVKIIEIL